MKKGPGLLTNQGFTLVELLVALLITGILIMGMSSVFLMSQKVYSRSGNISYKAGTVTNTETNLQNRLAVATDVYLASSPKTDDEESYSIGFNAVGDCEEYSTTTTVDGSGKTQYSKSVTSISHLAEIEVKATNNKTTTLNYKLIPKDETMSTLGGGTVMNNINETNKNQPKEDVPSQADLLTENGAELKKSGIDLNYLVLTFKPINGGAVGPGGIKDILKETGVIAGSWVKMIDYAKTTDDCGYRFDDIGSVYTDNTGTYVTAKAMYIGRDFVSGTPTAKDYLEKLNLFYGGNNTYFFEISETTRIITEADYETDATKWGCIWKADQYPKLGDLYLYNGTYYIWENKDSNVYSIKNATAGQGWLKLVSAPKKFQ